MAESADAAPKPVHHRWTHWLAPWMGSYGLVGLLLLGVAPILIPVTVDAHVGGHQGATAVGLVVAAFYVGGLLSPLIGTLADRTGRQRTLYLACFPVMGAAVIAFALVEGTLWWSLAALVMGGTGAAAGTLAGMFVVEANPQAEWDVRISWFRLVYGAGQVLGLVIAAVAATHAETGWLVTGILVLLGSLIGPLRLPKLAAVKKAAVTAKAEPRPEPSPSSAGRGVGVGGWAVHRHRSPLTALRSGLGGGFGLMLMVWFLTMVGVQTFFNVVPLVMQDAFRVSATASSLLFLVGAAIGTLVYPACGRLAARRGPGLVFVVGQAMTVLAFGAMTVMSLTGWAGGSTVGSAALVLAATAYSFLVVAATMLLAAMSPAGQGAAMGLLNALIAAGAVIGAVVPSFVAQRLGYDALPPVAAGVLVVAALLFLPLLHGQRGRGHGTRGG